MKVAVLLVLLAGLTDRMAHAQADCSQSSSYKLNSVSHRRLPATVMHDPLQTIGRLACPQQLAQHVCVGTAAWRERKPRQHHVLWCGWPAAGDNEHQPSRSAVRLSRGRLHVRLLLLPCVGRDHSVPWAQVSLTALQGSCNFKNAHGNISKGAACGGHCSAVGTRLPAHQHRPHCVLRSQFLDDWAPYLT